MACHAPTVEPTRLDQILGLVSAAAKLVQGAFFRPFFCPNKKRTPPGGLHLGIFYSAFILLSPFPLSPVLPRAKKRQPVYRAALHTSFKKTTSQSSPSTKPQNNDHDYTNKRDGSRECCHQPIRLWPLTSKEPAFRDLFHLIGRNFGHAVIDQSE